MIMTEDQLPPYHINRPSKAQRCFAICLSAFPILRLRPPSRHGEMLHLPSNPPHQGKAGGRQPFPGWTASAPDRASRAARRNARDRKRTIGSQRGVRAATGSHSQIPHLEANRTKGRDRPKCTIPHLVPHPVSSAPGWHAGKDKPTGRHAGKDKPRRRPGDSLRTNHILGGSPPGVLGTCLCGVTRKARPIEQDSGR
jgi:hypothetical protein